MVVAPSSRSLFYSVLIVDLVGSTQLYQRVGDQRAFELINRCLQTLAGIITSHSGRIIKHTGDGVLATFEQANHAADAALLMHGAVCALSITDAAPLSVRVGVHSGEVIESDIFGETALTAGDIFGETVNITARVAALASPGRPLITAEAARDLSADRRAQLSALPPRILRGDTEVTELLEFHNEDIGDEVTMLQDGIAAPTAASELRLYLNEQRLVINNRTPVATLGRDPNSDLRVCDQHASRCHATIELRGSTFMLLDRSSNGTWVIYGSDAERFLAQEERVLHGQGQIALGRSNHGNPYSIYFICL